MSKEFSSEIQIPIEQHTVMDSNVSSSLEIKEKVLDSKENQNPETKGVEITVIDKEVVKEDEVISMGFKANPNSEEEKKVNQEIFEKGLTEDSIKEVCCQVQNSSPEIGFDESDCGVWGESSASGGKETDNVNGLGSMGLGKKCSKRKFTDTNLKKNVLSIFAEARNVCENKSDGCKRRYTRNEMEALRDENSYLQRQIWREIYTGLGPVIAKELNCSAEDRQKSNGNTGKRKQRRRKPKQHNQHLQQSQEHHQKQAGVSAENASFMGCSQIMELNMEECSLGEEIMDNTVVCDGHDDGSTYYENEESDDEYDSIKRPAFYVEGDPDFDSGPPEDGLEYLRRVRYEAAQIPDVKVVKVDKSKLDKEQTKYMPEIPDIAKCPPHLQPSKEWEDAFLADFSELRQALPHLEGSKIFQPMSVADVDDASRCSRDPTVSVILGLDDVARVSMLKRCINSFDTKSSLCRNDCAWLFALFVAVGIPLNADTTASVRSLLRKCASLRAGKLEASEDDEEVVMLNMLATICGRFFGQLD